MFCIWKCIKVHQWRVVHYLAICRCTIDQWNSVTYCNSVQHFKCMIVHRSAIEYWAVHCSGPVSWPEQYRSPRGVPSLSHRVQPTPIWPPSTPSLIIWSSSFTMQAWLLCHNNATPMLLSFEKRTHFSWNRDQGLDCYVIYSNSWKVMS